MHLAACWLWRNQCRADETPRDCVRGEEARRFTTPPATAVAGRLWCGICFMRTNYIVRYAFIFSHATQTTHLSRKCNLAADFYGTDGSM
jgi:hypothetical protein